MAIVKTKASVKKTLATKAVKVASKVVSKAKVIEKKSADADLVQLAEAAKVIESCGTGKCGGKMRHCHKHSSSAVYCL